MVGRIKKRRTVRKKAVKNFGENLKKERGLRGMTRDQVAMKARISPGTLQKIEEGVVKNPSIATVMDIVNSLEVDKNKLANILGIRKMAEMEEGLSEEFSARSWGSKK